MSYLQHLPADSSVDLRGAFRHAAASTWVVGSARDGCPVGFTAISVTSVSVAPPLVSFNLGKTSSSRAAIESSGAVALHLLHQDQDHLARRFAGDRARRFVDDGEWAWADDGLPTLRDYVVRLTAEVVGRQDAGDSFVVTARVREQAARGGKPLIHHHGSYRCLDGVGSVELGGQCRWSA